MANNNKGLSYAEDTLGVHAVWREARDLQDSLADLYRTRGGLESGSRQVNNQIEERRRAILMMVTDELAESGEKVTQALIDRTYKLRCSSDEELAGMNRILEDTMAQRDSVNAEIAGKEIHHKGYTARMNELGGLCQFLAAIKIASLQADTWPY